MLVLHQEADGRAVGSAAEAVIETLGGAHGERRRFLVVKRTACFELTTRFLELHVTPDDFRDVGSGDQIVDKVLRNHGVPLVDVPGAGRPESVLKNSGRTALRHA